MAETVVSDTVEAFLDSEYELTDEQIRSLHEESWAFLPGLLSAETVEAVRSHLANLPMRETKASDSFFAINPVAGEAGHAAQNKSHDGMAWRDPFFMRTGTSRRLAGTAVRLMKQKGALFAQDMSFYKPSGAQKTWYHQDYPSWPFDRKGTVTFWIALVDIAADMGPLNYIERSHLGGPLGRYGSGQDIRDDWTWLQDLPLGGAKSLRAGDAQAHWDMTVHGAAENTGAHDREAYALRYIPTAMVHTGVGHQHYDRLGMSGGARFRDNSEFPLVDENGLVTRPE